MSKAVILLSGGIDSTVVLALAKQQKKMCYALSFDYKQRHRIELIKAKEIADYYQVPHFILYLDTQFFTQSSLVSSLAMPTHRTLLQIQESGIPNTYVPARNTIFLSHALALCEQVQAQEIHFGPNQGDAAGYPDCRPAYLAAFQHMMQLATKQQAKDKPMQLVTPLLEWSKGKIIAEGLKLKAPLHLTHSCYQPVADDKPCLCCDACLLRAEGFLQANAKDC